MTAHLTHATARRLALGVVMGGFEGTVVPDWLLAEAESGLASVCLFAQNTPDVRTARSVSDQLHQASPHLVVCVDEEGGDVTRLQASRGSSLPGNAALGELDDVDMTRWCGTALGEMGAAAGIDVALGPVLDVVSEPCSSVISTRSFGSDPKRVVRHASAWLEGLSPTGTRGCAKHFPGHGSTAVDSHTSLPTLTCSPGMLRERDMAPFVALADRLDAIMTAHIAVPHIGEQPASLSGWSTEILRDAGFTGVIVTDALGMRAITATRTLGEAAILALQAGADLLCLDAPQEREPRAALQEVVAAIVDALMAGSLDPRHLEASAARNRRLARDPGTVRGDEAAAQAHLDRVGLAAARSAVTVRGDCSVAGGAVVMDLRTATNLAVDRSTAFVDTLLRHVPQCRLATHPGDVGSDEVPLLITRMGHCDPEETAALNNVLSAHPRSIVVHGGLATTAPEHGRAVLCHGGGRANARAAAEVLDR